MGKKVGFFLIIIISVYLNFNTLAKTMISKNYNETKLLMPKMYFVNEGYIYYVSENDGLIYKVRVDGKDKKQITKDRVFTDGMLLSGMIMDGKFIYYINESDKNRLYRINRDGTGKICIAKRSLDISDGFYLLNGYIYYFSGFNFFKISIDGKEMKLTYREREICQMYFNSFKKILYNNYIYFLQRDGIYKIKIDGTNKCKVVSGGIYDFKVVNSSVFYINEKDLCLYKDGKKIVNNRILKDTGYEWIGNFDISNEYIYYTNADDDMKIYKMKIDTKEKSIIGVKAASFKVNGNIYYIDSVDRTGLYNTDLNGKKNYEIAKGQLLYIYEVDNDLIFYSTYPEDENDFYLGRCFVVQKNGKTAFELN
ncbi:DUF5050 domain-containing protein [Caloramator sp. E03]|uniref:DUF5050 domain-containing protein n=1 Tax=Caloramator sp. E03 TaxID=2576307 RepID=UPI00143D5AF2|nr:DUF5050 domain-containing protein [Caloramator sp. E03]